MILTQLAEARGAEGNLVAHFSQAVASGDRAVLADTDEASIAAAGETRKARAMVAQDMDRLVPLLTQLGYTDERALLDQFSKSFKDYQALDDTLLALAIENTNVKAQRMAFGPQQQAVDAFRHAVDTAAHGAAGAQSARADASAARAAAAVLEIQVLEGRHIAEADEQAMTALETQMNTADKAAHAALESLQSSTPAAARGSLGEAAEALARFDDARNQIIALSRRNTNVRSAALALGRKRALAAMCEDTLAQLTDALSKHQFAATK